MLELRVIQNQDGTWELWVNRTFVNSEFVTKEAAWNYADRYLIQFDKSCEARAEKPKAAAEVSGTAEGEKRVPKVLAASPAAEADISRSIGRVS